MRTKLLIAVMSLFLVVGFSSLVSAVSDPADDSIISTCEIIEANIGVFPDGDGIEKYMEISLEMESGSSLPGVMLIDIGVDGITDNGGCGMHDIPIVNCQTGTKKPGALDKDCVAGVDLSITVVLDNQQDECPTAWASGCKGLGGQCFKRLVPCCSITDCYEGTITCIPGAADCYLAGDVCDAQNPACNGCFIMTQECTDQNPCAQGRLIGEWFAVRLSPVMMSEPYADRGRIDMPLPPQGGVGSGETELLITLPYRRIVENVKAVGSHLQLVPAADPSNIEWQLHAWEDGASGGCDYISTTNPSYPDGCVSIVDIVPNAGLASVGTVDGDACQHYRKKLLCCADEGNAGSNMDYDECATYDGDQGACEGAGCVCFKSGCKFCVTGICMGNSEPLSIDGDADGADAGRFKRGFGRLDCPCN